MDRKIVGQRDEQVSECMGKWMSGLLSVGGWMDGWMDRWIDGWMDGWMDGWAGKWINV
jgi:hypothetical protein